MKSKEVLLFRHGDVLLKSIDILPKGLKLCKGTVIAEGTATGHKHRFKESIVKVYRSNIDKLLYVRVPITMTHLIHDEHDTLNIPKGNYIVIVQREYDLVEGVRKVLD